MLEVKEVSKIYESDRGIQDFNLSANRGEVICLIGPNGAGKTTIIKILAGVMKSDSGICTIDDIPTVDVNAKFKIGYLPENVFVYDRLTVYSFLRFVAVMKEIINFEEEIKRLLFEFDLWKYRDEIIKKLSMGMKKKIGIIVALLGYPSLIILDEPTNGLDTKGIISLKNEIKKAKDRGCIIVISSHILDFVRYIGSKFIFIKSGRVVKRVSTYEGIDLEEIYSILHFPRKRNN
ncbi:ABC-type multidrug transport system, ATPase component [Caloranaerobacter azorensis DSM 13643]|uniref:ABC-type multidrug transport system, ATPase component n=1 Tax=Caloranaerobacter azorensis DSM 13643 TaxID=1121264 RepID=A0A1M5R394_9FIRM|nr:ABC transporter ATP-binding protein [Caloranaerobacter azorensis]SHH20877.1 ABC-type multidrug transport system, ATPase component [Caloranaerobacter azorensis DSM 13643]